MTKFYSGVAGRRPNPAKGVVIHNDAGSQNANANFYRNWLPNHEAEDGFAHVYIGSDGRYQAEAYENMAWHTANADGNANYVGWEVCQSTGDEKTFLENEQKVFQDVANYMKSVGMTPNRNTVRLHKEFSSTSCPHRSWDLHGQSVDAVKDYFISQINKYLTGKESSVQISNPQPNPTNNTGQKVSQGIYRVDDIQNVNGIWQVRCNFLVPVDFNWTDNGIAVEDIVLVDGNGYILNDQTTKTGSLFVFNIHYIQSVGSPQTGSGGYKWARVNLTHSDNIWLSVIDKNDLINKISNA